MFGNLYPSIVAGVRLCKLLLSLALLTPVALPGLEEKDPPVSQLNCEALRTGLFYYRASSGSLIIIERGQNFQTQYRVYGRYYKRERIEWIEPCTYRLTVVENQDPALDEEPGTVYVTSVTGIFQDRYETTNLKDGQTAPDGPIFFVRDKERILKEQSKQYWLDGILPL